MRPTSSHKERIIEQKIPEKYRVVPKESDTRITAKLTPPNHEEE